MPVAARRPHPPPARRACPPCQRWRPRCWTPPAATTADAREVVALHRKSDPALTAHLLRVARRAGVAARQVTSIVAGRRPARLRRSSRRRGGAECSEGVSRPSGNAGTRNAGGLLDAQLGGWLRRRNCWPAHVGRRGVYLRRETDAGRGVYLRPAPRPRQARPARGPAQNLRPYRRRRRDAAGRHQRPRTSGRRRGPRDGGAAFGRQMGLAAGRAGRDLAAQPAPRRPAGAGGAARGR